MDKILLPQSYHNFSDKRTILGIPNGFNVLSNFAILIPAIIYYRKRNKNNLSLHKSFWTIALYLLCWITIELFYIYKGELDESEIEGTNIFGLKYKYTL